MRPLYGGDEENRTPDPLLARQVLSQLSYTPILLVLVFSFACSAVCSICYASFKVLCTLIPAELHPHMIWCDLFTYEVVPSKLNNTDVTDRDYLSL